MKYCERKINVVIHITLPTSYQSENKFILTAYQGGWTRDAKRRNLDVSLLNGQTLTTLFVNTPSKKLQHNITINTYKHSDQEPSDEVNTAASLATEGRIDRNSFGK